jgi:membrane protein DedA with SNARE-associated domain
VESHTLLSHLAEAWAYVTLGASGIITEEVAPIVGGFAAHEGHLGFIRVVLACAIGTWAAGVGLYAVGRWRSKWVRKRFRRIGRYVTRLLVFVRRSPWRSAFAVRFAFGARIVLPIACGAARLKIPIFLIGSAIASVVWATAFALVGWLFGETALLVLGHIRKYDDIIAGLLIVSVVIAGIIFTRRRHSPGLLPERPLPNEITGEGDRIATPDPLIRPEPNDS